MISETRPLTFGELAQQASGLPSLGYLFAGRPGAVPYNRIFSQQRSAWIEPEDVIQALVSFEAGQAFRRNVVEVSLNLPSEKLLEVQYSTLRALIDEFLAGFVVDPHQLSVFRARIADRFSDRSWRWLSSCQFVGHTELRMTSRPFRTWVRVDDRRGFLLLVRQPLYLLGGFVSGLVEFWRNPAPPGTFFYVRSSAATPFAAYIESRLAAVCGVTHTVQGAVSERAGCNVRFDAVTIFGKLPIDARMIATAAQSRFRVFTP